MEVSAPLRFPRLSSPGQRGQPHGSVLLEVLLALILFAATAAVVTTAFNSSMASLERQRLGLQGLNLAASVMAEVQLGILPASSDSSFPFDPPFEDWTWETASSPTETDANGATGLTRLEVVIRHKKSTTVQRLGQLVRSQVNPSTNSVVAPPEL